MIEPGAAEKILHNWLRRNKGAIIIGEDLRKVVYGKGKRLRHPNMWGPLIARLRNDRWLVERNDLPLRPMTGSRSNARRSIVYMVAW